VSVDRTTLGDDLIVVEGDEVLGSSLAMTSHINLRVVIPGSSSVRGRVEAIEVLERAVGDALSIFHDVERICSRFIATSPLSVVNAEPTRQHVVPELLFDAVTESFAAYLETGARFDPRVLANLVALGYSTSLPFESSDVVTASGPRVHRSWTGSPWRFRGDRGSHSIHLDGFPIDLGGIGKGLAVRWASERLAVTSDDFLVEAGGDCYCAGRSPDDEPWRVGIEDPRGGSDPVAVLSISDRGVATSSTRLRRWNSGTTPVHHLIDPRTGDPGGEGLVAVTTVDRDPARAEVWSKALFLEGADGIAGLARENDADALWIRSDGSVRYTESFADIITWAAP